MSVLAADEAGEAAAAAFRDHERRKRRRPALEEGHSSPRRCPLVMSYQEHPSALTIHAASSLDQVQRQHRNDQTSGPKAALVLSEWLGNALVCPSSPSQNREIHVSLLGQLVGADVALPRHVALILSCLEHSSDRRVRLEVVAFLAGLTPNNVFEHLPVLAARLVSDPCATIRMAVLTALSGPFIALSQPYVPLVIACLEDMSAPVRRSATKALVQIGGNGLLKPKYINSLRYNLLSRCSAVREDSMQVLCALLYLTRTCFRAKRLLEAPLWKQHGAVASLAVARESSPAVRVLGLQFLTDLPRHLCAQHVGIAIQRVGDARPEAQAAALTFLQRNLDPDLLRPHVHALLQLLRPYRPHSFSSSSYSSYLPSSLSARCELTVLKCLHLVPERALEPFVDEIIAAVKAVKESKDENGGLDKQQQQQQQQQTTTYLQSVQTAAVDVFGCMRTAVVLPLLEKTLMIWVFGCLCPPLLPPLHPSSTPSAPPSVRTTDTLLVRQAMNILQRVRNAEIKQACLARLATSLRGGGGGSNSIHSHQARVLMVLAESGPRVVQTHADTITYVLQCPTTASRVRHEALKTLLIVPPAQLTVHAHATVRMLFPTGKEGEGEAEGEAEDHKEAARWREAALEVLQYRKKEKIALVCKSVTETTSEGKEEGEENEEVEEGEGSESDKENEAKLSNCIDSKKQVEKGNRVGSAKETGTLPLEAMKTVSRCAEAPRESDGCG